MNPSIYVGLGDRTRRDFMTSRHEATMKEIISTVGSYFKLSYGQVIGKNRTTRFAMARHIAWTLLKEFGYGVTIIGKVCSVNHSTVINAIGKIHDQRNIDPLIKRAYDSLKVRIRKNLETPNITKNDNNREYH